MSEWPKYNPDRHDIEICGYLACLRCGSVCNEGWRCRCCETARADDAEDRIADALAVPLNAMYRNGERDALHRILDILEGKP